MFMDLNKKIFIENLFNLGPCEDNPTYAERCPGWAALNDGLGCSVYADFMSKHCKKSCNKTCGPGGMFYLLFIGQKYLSQF